MTADPPRARSALLLKLALAAAALIAASLWLASGHDLGALVQQVVDALRSAGPAAFFLAMALLPALGAPLSFFCLTAGSVFGPQLGMPMVIVFALAAIAANIALSYLLASRALRPPLEALLKRLGYQMPRVAKSGDATDLIVLVRVTPGLPFPVQNYLLGLAGVPFARYQLVSCLIAFPLNAAIIFFGEALLQGKGRTALVGLLLVLALMAGIHLLRRRYLRTNTSC